MSESLTVEKDGEIYNIHPENVSGWVCFHCGEHLKTRGAAQDHFGATPDKVPGCIVKAGDERGLLMALRKAEAEVDRLRTDIENDTTGAEVFYSQLKSHLNSYKPFRGCRDIGEAFMVYDSMEGEALAAKEQVEQLLAGYPEGMTPTDVEKLHEYNAGLAMESHQQQERIAELIDKDALISSVLHYRDAFHDGDDEFDAGGRYAIKMVIKMANEGKFNPTKPTPHPAESENSNG